MRSLIIDDNFDFASKLAARFGDSSELLFEDGLPPEATLTQVQEQLDRKLDTKEGPSVVLINRELRLKGFRRQDSAGESLLAEGSWKYDAHFLLYSFRLLPDNVVHRGVLLPSDFAGLPVPNGVEAVDLKIDECLSYIDKSFKKIQHGFKEVSPTAVDVIRLINGAVKAGRIRSEAQFKRLEELLFSFSYLTVPSGEKVLGKAFDFDEAIHRLVELIVRQGTIAGMTSNSTGIGGNSIQRITVVDDEIIEEEGDYRGQSPWASLLDVVFDGSGLTFSTMLPSELEFNVSGIADADLVLLDIDFELDAAYKGERVYGGLDLLKKIRQEFPRIPVLVMSRFDEIGLYEECMRLGCFDYVTKSWSGYRKFRTQESERDWFLLWQTRIDVPLRFHPLFEDIELLRQQEIVSRKESDHFLVSLRDIESPSVETTRSLVAFFEQFVIGYLYYRGQTPDERLSDCLNNAVFALNGGKNSSLGQVLRIIRNNVTHYSAYADEKHDAWLVLMLVRTFYLGLVSPTRLTDVSVLIHLNENLMAEMPNDFEVDEHFFKNSGGSVSPSNRKLFNDRNKVLQKCVTSGESEPHEFEKLADAFVKSLAVVLPRSQLQKGFQLPSLADYDPKDLVKKLIRPYRHGGRFKRGYELLSSVWWFFELFDQLAGSSQLLDAAGKSVLRAMSVRCWIWYFRQLLKEPNEVLFSSSLEELKIDRNTALGSVEPKVVQHFHKRKMHDFVSAYCLLVGLTHINKILEQKKAEFQTESSALNERLEALSEDLKNRENVYLQIASELSQKNEEVMSLESQWERLGPLANRRELMETFLKVGEKLDNARRAKVELETATRQLQNESSQIRTDLEDVKKRQAGVAEVFAALNDAAGGRMSVIDKADILARRVRRQFRFVERFAKPTFLVSAWISRVVVAFDFQAANSCMSELRDALGQDNIANAAK